jgi:hypothetical protein
MTMMRWLTWFGIVLIVTGLCAGCAGDEKGVNHNKEKPLPEAK